MDIEIPPGLWIAIAGLIYVLTELVKQVIKGRVDRALAEAAKAERAAAAEKESADKKEAAELVAKKVEEVKATLVTKGDKADEKLDHITKLTNSTATKAEEKIESLAGEVTALKSDIARTAVEAVAKAVDARLEAIEKLLVEGPPAKRPLESTSATDPVPVKVVAPEVQDVRVVKKSQE